MEKGRWGNDQNGPAQIYTRRHDTNSRHKVSSLSLESRRRWPWRKAQIGLQRGVVTRNAIDDGTANMIAPGNLTPAILFSKKKKPYDHIRCHHLLFTWFFCIYKQAAFSGTREVSFRSLFLGGEGVPLFEIIKYFLTIIDP